MRYALTLLILATFAIKVSADWNYYPSAEQNEISMTVGYWDAPQSPTTPPTDSSYVFEVVNGQRQVRFFVMACCYGICLPPYPDLGVAFIVTTTVHTVGGGTHTASTPQAFCCTPCCRREVNTHEATPGAWGAGTDGDPAYVGVSVTANCICCALGTWGLSDTDEYTHTEDLGETE
jgi:hypothetical protein